MPNLFKVLHSTCCGIDVHKKTLVVVCLLKTDESGEYLHTIRTFSTMTIDLEILKSWLREEGCKKIAIESTGVYWIPVFNVLERDFEVILATMTQVKNFPGKKNNPGDAQWTAKLLALNLINNSFIPSKNVRELRELTQYRDRLMSIYTLEKDRIGNILESSNLTLASVAADVLDASEMAMINTLIERQSDSGSLEIVESASRSIRDKIPVMVKALEGRVESYHAAILPVVFEHFFFLREQLAVLEKRIREKVKPYQQEFNLLDIITEI